MNKWFSLLAAVLLLCACETQVGAMKMPVAPVMAEQEYQIGVGDQLSVQVWKSPELSVIVPVRPDGKISVPLIGDVIAAGQSTQSMSNTLSKGFNEYVRNAQVTVIVLNPASGEYLRRVRVTGAVKAPISIPHKQGITVLDLVLESGGLTEFASGNSARLYRKTGDKMETYAVRLDDILQKGELSTNFTLAPADIVTVPERLF